MAQLPKPEIPVSRAIEIVLANCKMHPYMAEDLRYLLAGAREREAKEKEENERTT